MFKTTNCLQWRISRSCAAEVEADVLTREMTPCLWLVTHRRKPEGSAESHREVSIHPDKKRPVLHVTWRLMGAFPGWVPGYQSRISLRSPLLICFCFSKPSLWAFKPFQIGKAFTVKWWRVFSYTDLKYFDRAQIFRHGICLNLTRAWTTPDCNEPKPDLIQILTNSQQMPAAEQKPDVILFSLLEKNLWGQLLFLVLTFSLHITVL